MRPPLSLWMGMLLVLLVAVDGSAQRAGRGPQDPLAGSFRGTLTTPQGEEHRAVITFIRVGDTYRGTISGFQEDVEVPLTNIMLAGNKVTAETAMESDLGPIIVRYDLDLEENTVKGTGEVDLGWHLFTVALEGQRRGRLDVPQPQVKQRLDYFVGTWNFEYIGAEYPPLSVGSRTGTVVFAQLGDTNFLEGHVEGESFGDKFEETILLGYDDKTMTLVFLEHLSTGAEVVSIGSWKSPIAINFTSSPVEADGQLLTLQRTLRVTSELAFPVTAQPSVDGGRARRLGNGYFTKVR